MTLHISIANSIPNTPPHGPLGKKNSASSRAVAYPPPITTALKANPGRNHRLKIDLIAAHPLSGAYRRRKTAACSRAPPPHQRIPQAPDSKNLSLSETTDSLSTPGEYHLP